MELERNRPAAGPVRVAVAAADPLVASAISRLLEEAGAVIVEEIDEAEVVLWDAGADVAGLPQRLGEIDRLRAPCVVMLADGADAATAIAAGASGAVSRDGDGALLAAAAAAARAGLLVLDLAFGNAIAPAPAPPASGGVDALTAREREVLDLLASGLSNKRIAAELGISEHTAKFHVNSILAKLGADTRTEAVVTAVRRGLLVL